MSESLYVADLHLVNAFGIGKKAILTKSGFGKGRFGSLVNCFSQKTSLTGEWQTKIGKYQGKITGLKFHLLFFKLALFC